MFNGLGENELLVGEFPSTWGLTKEKAFQFLNSFTQSLQGLCEDSDTVKPKHYRIYDQAAEGKFGTSESFNTALHEATLMDALEQAFGGSIPDAMQPVRFHGKISTRGTNAVYGLDLGGKSYALKLYTEHGSPLAEYRTWRFFEGQDVKNSMRVYACNAGVHGCYQSTRMNPDRISWILSERVTDQTLQLPNRGIKKITEVAEAFQIDLGNPNSNHPAGVDSVAGVAVDGGLVTDPKQSSESSFQRNLAAWKAEGF